MQPAMIGLGRTGANKCGGSSGADTNSLPACMVDRSLGQLESRPENADIVPHPDPIFRTLAPGRGNRDRAGGTAEEGYLHYGPSGAGPNILHKANVGKQSRETDAETTPLRNLDHYQYDLNLADVTEVWRGGSVVASWLLDLTAISLLAQPRLEGFSGRVSDSGEGRWTLQATIDESAPHRFSARCCINDSVRRAHREGGWSIVHRERRNSGHNAWPNP
jgi:6-phosphogluconate dehydrogenase (decarboxylating)